VKTGVFVQARVNSNRLPGKILLPLAGIPVITHIMNALYFVPGEYHVVLTNEQSANQLSPLVESRPGWEMFVGPDEDVLARFALAAEYYNVDRVLRVTGDNPAISYSLGRLLVRRTVLDPYITHQDVAKGLGSELISADALVTAHRNTMISEHREHVSPYIIETIGRKTLFPPIVCYPTIPDANLSLDTQEDYARLSRLFDELYQGRPLRLDTVMEWSAKQWSVRYRY